MMTTQTDDPNLEQLEQQLRATLYRFDCPSTDQLRELCWNKVDAKETETLRNHLTICPLCNEEYAELEQLIGSMSRQASPAAAASSPSLASPKNLATRLAETLNSLRDNTQQTVENLQREVAMVVAHLVSGGDSLQPATVALRGDSERTFFFEVAGNMLSLVVQKDESARLIIDGQLLGEPVIGDENAGSLGECVLQSAQIDQAPQLSTIDELGHFVFMGVPSGDYQLTIVSAQQRILVPSLSLRG